MSDLLLFSDFANPENEFSRTSEQITYDAACPRQMAWLANDFGAGFFSGDFTHTFEYEMNHPTVEHYFASYALTKTLISDTQTVLVSGDKMIQIRVGYTTGFGGTAYIQALEWDGLVLKAVDFRSIPNATHYYIRVARDESIGLFGRLNIYVFTGSLDGTPVTAFSIDLNAKVDYSNGYAMQCNSGIGGTNPDVDGYSKNYNFGEVVSAYYQQLIRNNRRGLN